MDEDVAFVQIHYDKTVVFGVIEKFQATSVSSLGCLDRARNRGSVWLCGIVVVDGLYDWTLRFHLGNWAFGGRVRHYWHLNMLRVGHVAFWLASVIRIMIVIVVHLRGNDTLMVICISLEICGFCSSCNALVYQFGGLG